MKFSLARDALLAPLQMISGVVEKKQTMPVLSNVLIDADNEKLTLTGTNTEVELICRLEEVDVKRTGQITVPAKKLAEICRSLDSIYPVEIEQDGNKIHVRSGRNKFTLATLPAEHFPNTENEVVDFSVTIPQIELKQALDATAFAMAQQDVRYYLNGMLFEMNDTLLRLVATDGHRLAMADIYTAVPVSELHQVIIPRKGIMELSRLLSEEGDVQLEFNHSHIRSTIGNFTFTSKLIEGKFPDYTRVIPRGGDKVVIADRVELKGALVRAGILSHENIRGVRVNLEPGQIEVVANNPDQEHAEVYQSVDYNGEPLQIGFNVSYLIDVMNSIQQEQVKLTLSNPNSSALVEPQDGPKVLYVVMPMRL